MLLTSGEIFWLLGPPTIKLDVIYEPLINPKNWNSVQLHSFTSFSLPFSMFWCIGFVPRNTIWLNWRSKPQLCCHLFVWDTISALLTQSTNYAETIILHKKIFAFCITVFFSLFLKSKISCVYLNNLFWGNGGKLHPEYME